MRMALPAGRLESPSWAWLKDQGVLNGRRQGRTLLWTSEGLEIAVVRSRDIPRLLASRAVDVAILGRDVAEEWDEPLWMSDSLGFGECRLMLALPKRQQWDASRPWRVATRYTGIAARWFEARGVQAALVPMSGSVEVAPRLGLADAVVDVVETGETLRQNGLKPVETVFESYAVLVTRAGESARTGRLGWRLDINQEAGNAACQA